MFNTTYMGLTAWDLGTDPYDHSQLASNFVAIDAHDHNAAAGRGKQIGSDGLAKPSITGEHIYPDAVNPAVHIPAASIPQSRLANNSVGRPQLQDDAVGPDELADGTVTLDKLAPDVLPIGMVVLWYRGDSSILPPDNWEVMDGRTWATIDNSMGPGGTQLNTGNIPNMRNKFALGAALSGTGVGTATPPDIGGIGGSHTADLNHTHTGVAHSHTVNSHVHGIVGDGAHKHRFEAWVPFVGTSLRELYSRDVGVPRAEGTRQALYVQDHNKDSFAGSDVLLPMETVAAHAHGGSTAGATSGTNSVTTTVDDALGAEDIRPAYVGLIYIMKVN